MFICEYWLTGRQCSSRGAFSIGDLFLPLSKKVFQHLLIMVVFCHALQVMRVSKEHGKTIITTDRHTCTFYLVPIIFVFVRCVQTSWWSTLYQYCGIGRSGHETSALTALPMAASATTQIVTKRRIGPTQSPVVSATISKKSSEVKAIHALRKAGLTGFLALFLLLDW